MRDLLGTEGQDVDMMMGTEDQQQQQQQEHNQDADGVADGDDVTHLTGGDGISDSAVEYEDSTLVTVTVGMIVRKILPGMYFFPRTDSVGS